MQINDPVFGTMEYDYGWKKTIPVTLFGKEYHISCIASAYEGEQINDTQRAEFQRIMEDFTGVCHRVEQLLQKYCAANSSHTADDGSLRPTDLIFDQNGGCGFLFDCVWEPDDGIAMRISPKEEIGTQDIIL